MFPLLYYPFIIPFVLRFAHHVYNSIVSVFRNTLSPLSVLPSLSTSSPWVDTSTTRTNPSIGGHLEVVRLLLENGADPNVRKDHVTSLSQAQSGGHLEIVQLLLKYGAE